jgi:hypothetical protein
MADLDGKVALITGATPNVDGGLLAKGAGRTGDAATHREPGRRPEGTLTPWTHPSA